MITALTIAAGFADVLRVAVLDSFQKIMSLPAPQGSVTRAVPGRFTTRIEAGSGVFYVKRYRGFKAAWQAQNEWEHLHDLREAGIGCPTPVAFGEQRGLFTASESFVMTQEIPHATQGDWWVRDHPERRNELLAPVAELARKFHREGFSHKDFYLCHFFVQETPGETGIRILLLDLQRCDRPVCFARRWRVKDLAQLHFSMTQQSGFTQEDWAELMKLYGAATDASLLRAVASKSARIARHVPKHG